MNEKGQRYELLFTPNDGLQISLLGEERLDGQVCLRPEASAPWHIRVGKPGKKPKRRPPAHKPPKKKTPTKK